MKAADKPKIRDAANRSPVGRYIYAGKLNGIPDLNAPPAITESQAGAICKEFKFPAEIDRGFLIRHVNVSAQVYWANQLAQLRQPKSKAIKSEIKKISETTNDLISALAELSPQAARLFWRPEQIVESQPWHGLLNSGVDSAPVRASQSEFGHTLVSVRAANSSDFRFRITEDHHFESLKILSSYSEYALANFSSRRAGRPRSEALNLLVTSSVNFWREVLGREFHADYKGGAAANIPTHFAIKLSQIVDPGVPESQVITVARRIVKDRRNLPPLKNVVGN